MRLVLWSAIAACLLSTSVEQSEAQSAAQSVALAPYWRSQVQGLYTADLEIDGTPARMIFDTGAGITTVTPEFAQRLGCPIHGRVSGFRMRGDRIEVRKCGTHEIAIGAHREGGEIVVLDLATILPESAPPVDGIVGLEAFAGGSVILRLADGNIEPNALSPGEGWTEGVMRLQREMSGAGLTVFVQASAQEGTLWLLLDSGHAGGPVYLSPGAAEQLGALHNAGVANLEISGIGPRAIRAEVVDSLIYDGVLGEAFLRDFDIHIDLRNSRIWWRPRTR